MTDDEIRALVREAIARNLGHRSPSPGQPMASPPWRAHPSFGRLLVASGTEEGGPCIIEPNVHCNHCGYCQSYGH